MPAFGQETDVIDRLWAKTEMEGECRIWTGKTTGKGYGEIWYHGRGVRIGRLICYLFHNADLSDKSWVAAHKRNCTSSRCWNPEHLEVTTQKMNVLDQIIRGTFHYGTDNLFDNSRRGPKKDA